VIPAMVLLPSTICMGATLPAMERTISLMYSPKRLGGLYAANTLGACIGTWLIVFYVAPSLGFSKSLLILAGMNGLCALGFGLLSRRQGNALSTLPQPVPKQVQKGFDSSSNISLKRKTFWTLFCTGFLGIGYEILCVRALSQVLENTVFSYAVLLVVYLLGTAIGAAAYQRWISRSNQARKLDLLFTAVMASCLLGTAVLPLVSTVSNGSGDFGAAALVFLLPTICMGALFSELAQTAVDLGIDLGQALAMNTLGAALSPVLIGLALLPWLGVRISLVVCSVVYMGFLSSVKGLRRALWIGLLVAAPIVIWSGDEPEKTGEERVIRVVEGSMARVAVTEDLHGVRRMKVNNHYQMGSTANPTTERRLAILPLLWHPRPERALFLGVGTGVTLGGATLLPISRIDAAELLPEILSVLPDFAPANRWPYPSHVRMEPVDARRFVKASRESYQVIVADLFHPARDGAGTLYTKEHFQSIRSRLTSDGLFCQWLPLYQMETPILKIIIHTFLQVFPETHLMLGNLNVDRPGIGLVGSLQHREFKADWFSIRTASSDLRSALNAEGLSDEYRFFAGYLAGPDELAAFAEGAELNTDDRPIVMYSAPEVLSQADNAPAYRLRALIEALHPKSARLAGDADSNRTFVQNLEKVWQARNEYLSGAIAEMEARPQEAREHYVRSATITPHFLVGYAKGIEAVLNHFQSEPEAMRRLAQQLARVRPEVQDAKILLAEIFGDSTQIESAKPPD
jgi:spermidine synthase